MRFFEKLLNASGCNTHFDAGWRAKFSVTKNNENGEEIDLKDLKIKIRGIGQLRLFYIHTA